MRGIDHQQADMYSYLSPEMRVRADHPLRAIRSMADEALANMSERFDGMYAKTGRPSIPPEKFVAGSIDPDALLGAKRTFADGRDRLQHVVPMVRWHELGRAGVGCYGLHQESGPVTGRRRGAGV